ncbi:contactin-5, partial [Exaiptasia diaphana]|uniref:Ig-like domain-containing protein n=1 Tax=Exaiptasia diaphana TaxID=2652724 RepID=A0A913XQE9_EXADI
MVFLCIVHFSAAPSFNTRPRSVVFNERETAVLTCSAVANPRAEITWYRGNTQISDNHQGSSHHYRVDNRDVTPKASNRAKYCPSEIPHTVIQSTLMIRNSNGSDTGTYTCKGHNILGATRFEIHALIQVYVEFV